MTHHHIAWMFLVLIFAVLLSKLCNVLLCNYTVYLNSFSIRSRQITTSAPNHSFQRNEGTLVINAK